MKNWDYWIITSNRIYQYWINTNNKIYQKALIDFPSYMAFISNLSLAIFSPKSFWNNHKEY